jgi:hypothetical protein
MKYTMQFIKLQMSLLLYFESDPYVDEYYSILPGY